MKSHLLVARSSAAHGQRRAALALGLCAALWGSLAATAPAQAANLLANPGFDFVGPLGPTTSFTGLGASPSAAASWRVIHHAFGTTRTNLMPAPWGGRMLHVYTTAAGNGLLQAWAPFGGGPLHVKAQARVRVVQGKIAMGTGNGGAIMIDDTSAGGGVWEVLDAPNGVSPANTFALWAVSPGGAEFYIDLAAVWQ
jgi:hypothetical protein